MLLKHLVKYYLIIYLVTFFKCCQKLLIIFLLSISGKKNITKDHTCDSDSTINACVK